MMTPTRAWDLTGPSGRTHRIEATKSWVAAMKQLDSFAGGVRCYARDPERGELWAVPGDKNDRWVWVLPADAGAQ